MDEEWTKWVDWADRHSLPVNKNSVIQILLKSGNVITVHMQDEADDDDDTNYVKVRLKLPEGLIMLRKIAADVKEDA